MIVHEELDSSPRQDRSIYERLMQRISKKGELCRRLLERDEYDVIVIVFSESHTGGHQFWKYHLKGAAPEYDDESNALASAIQQIYQAIDSEIGKILRGVPDDPNVFVISSVGMKSQFPAAGLGEAFCRGFGYQASPRPRAHSPMAVLRRIIPPPIRDQLSRVLPRDTQEGLLSEKFVAGTDWPRTTLFSIPSYYTTFLWANLKGREPNGTVESGAEYDDLLDRARIDLERLTGRQAVRDVVRTVDLFPQDPPDALPDLFIEWAEADHFMDRLVHPDIELRQERCDFHCGSDHSRHGFVAAAGPGVVRGGDLGDIDPLDLAPTFVALLGAHDSEALQGTPLKIRSSENGKPSRRGVGA